MKDPRKAEMLSGGSFLCNRRLQGISYYTKGTNMTMIHTRAKMQIAASDRARIRQGAFFIIFTKEIWMIRTVGRRLFEKRSQRSACIELPGIIFLFVPDLNKIDLSQIRMYCLLDRRAAFTC